MTWTARPVPWRYVASWQCTTCGLCCRTYNVVLNYGEWLNIVRKFGVEYTSCDLSRLYLRRKPSGACVFLYRFGNKWLCGLQDMKPRACKLWPFKIYTKPRFGRAREAFYEYAGHRLFVYVDPNCLGIRWGEPTNHFAGDVLPEFVEIWMGRHVGQKFSTGKVRLPLVVQASISKKVYI